MTLGRRVEPGVYLWDLDELRLTDAGASGPVSVADGRLHFTDFVLPRATTVRFAGRVPVQIFVCGRVDVQGRIEGNGVDQVPFDCRNHGSVGRPVAGQPGSNGGPGGGKGGSGGDRCLGQGAEPAFDGRPGEDARVPAGHAFAQFTVGTGGRGAPMFPAHGRDAQLLTPSTYTLGGVVALNASVGSGGGGGGHAQAGGVARNVAVVPPVTQILPAAFAAGGARFDVLELAATASDEARERFLVGGAGGGGGGSHPFLARSAAIPQFDAERWKAGGGGAGGGGVLALRAGGTMTIGPDAVLTARGGDGARIDGDNPLTQAREEVTNPLGAHWGVPTPGGGGAGGSIVLQADGDLAVAGALDVRGGRGGFTQGLLGTSFSVAIDNRGGDGAPGIYRLESRGTVTAAGTAFVPALEPARHIGVLRDRDDLSVQRSNWRAIGTALPPEWLRYELEVDLDGDGAVDAVYSDDPAVAGNGPADDPLGAVELRCQGVELGQDGRIDAATIRPWRSYVARDRRQSLHEDAVTRFRFELRYRIGQFPNLVVRRLAFVVRQ